MQVITTLTQKGQLTIPKRLRDKYNLKEYDKVYLIEGDDFIAVKPAQDILDLAGKIKPKKKKSALKAREEMARRYQRS